MAEKRCLQTWPVCDVVDIPQWRMATATSWPPARDSRDTVNPPRALTNQQCSLTNGGGGGIRCSIYIYIYIYIYGSSSALFSSEYYIIVSHFRLHCMFPLCFIGIIILNSASNYEKETIKFMQLWKIFRLFQISRSSVIFIAWQIKSNARNIILNFICYHTKCVDTCIMY